MSGKKILIRTHFLWNDYSDFLIEDLKQLGIDIILSPCIYAEKWKIAEFRSINDLNLAVLSNNILVYSEIESRKIKDIAFQFENLDLPLYYYFVDVDAALLKI